MQMHIHVEIINYKRELRPFLFCFLLFVFFSTFWRTMFSWRLRIDNFGEFIVSINTNTFEHSSYCALEKEAFIAIYNCIETAMLSYLWTHTPTDSLEIFFKRDDKC